MYDYAYFRYPTSFAVFQKSRVISYDLELVLYGKNVSTIKAEGRFNITDPAIVQIGEMLFILGACSPAAKEDATTVSLKPFMNLFDRAIPFVQQNSIYEQLVADVTNNFINCSDFYYRCSWLSVQSAAISLPYVKPNVDDSGRYNLMEYIESLAENVIGFCYANAETITLRFLRRRFLPDDADAEISEMTTLEPVPFYDTTITRDMLESASFTMDLISKVTHYDPDAGTSTDYYLLDDGSVTTNGAAAGRVRGRWIVYSAANVNEGLIAAQFARSRYSHSITVFSPTKAHTYMNGKCPYYYARCRIKLPYGDLVESHVTSVRARSNENKGLRITAGKALTTLNEIIQEVRNARN